MADNLESRGTLGDINQKKRPERSVNLVEDDIVENPEEFDELRYFELTKDKEEKDVEEINTTVKKNTVNNKINENITDNDVQFIITAAFKRRVSYKDNILAEWIITTEQYKDLQGYYVKDSGFFIHAEFQFSWTDDDLIAQLDMLRRGLYLLQKSREWEKDDNCIEAHISNYID